ncbi:anti-repressor Ant [Diadromus pulchellus ascovirus 4a]|uniref:Complete DpAV4 genome n=1 Tax=Diadromus pulchellus ascovirus 4a TaxID=158683 RepID=F2NZ04_9VIRU|nr:anti-repressor Ant [Diadromus pulchellus ascovirus 4a]CCA61432.1 unnamed protein product [Diadromus pulchellus ascovirus 4a]
MLSLINLDKSTDKITVTIGEKTADIKLSGTTDDPYFCGKDICNILQYNDIKQALQNNVYDEDKKPLSALGVCGTPNPNSSAIRLGSYSGAYHEGRAVYVNEAGLYSLVLTSKAPFAREFKRYVCSVILPSIRKFGQFSVNQLALEYEQKLAIKDNERREMADRIEAERLAVQEREREMIERIESEKREMEKQIELERSMALKLKEIVVNMKAKDPTQIVYIATSEQYARRNRFKIGGVKSVELLKGRLSTYNSGRAVGDKYYYCHLVFCCDYRQVEARIEKCIGEFREVSESELYNIHYHAAVEVVDYISERFTEEIDKYRAAFADMLKDTLTRTPVVPEPLIINGAEYRAFRNGVEMPVQKVDWDRMDNEEKIEFLRTVFDEYVSSIEGGVDRREFERFMERVHRVKFNKRTLWPFLKRVATDRERAIKY